MATKRAPRESTPRPSTATTPWGAATVVEELTLPQRAGERRFATHVQLLETKEGERLVRFAYSTGGTARRGPVTLRARDTKRLGEVLGRHPELAAALASLRGGGGQGGD
jgi:hypothetical protein